VTLATARGVGYGMSKYTLWFFAAMAGLWLLERVTGA